MTASPYSAAQAQLLVQLASLAANDPNAMVLPDGWVSLQSFASTGTSYPPVQGFYAQGPMPGVTGSCAVLALGVPWQGFLNIYVGGAPALGAAPAWLNAPTAAQVDGVVANSYGNARALVWTNLTSAGSMPLFVTGMGLAGPVAQMAAADLRPGQTGPGTGQNAPTTAPVCYTFSTAAEGNAAYATFLAGAVPSLFTVGLGSAVLPVDQFPGAPATGYAAAGAATQLPALLPEWDDPWLERGIGAYLTALGGSYAPPPVQAATFSSNLPAGFFQAPAYTMACLCAVAQQRAQHPGGLTTPTGSYTVVSDVTANGVPFCTVFAGPDAVVAAFRGTMSWQETASVQGNSLGVTAPYLNSGTAMVHGGAATVAQSPVTAGSATTFRQALAALLTTIALGRPVVLAGFDFGGAMANLTATDLAINWTSLKPAAIYTFGAMPTGNFNYVQLFQASFPAGSYQVLRPGDFAGGVTVMNQYQPVSAVSVQVNGTPPNDDPTQHALAGYIALLDPWAAG